jgi:hypothetical protein
MAATPLSGADQNKLLDGAAQANLQRNAVNVLQYDNARRAGVPAPGTSSYAAQVQLGVDVAIATKKQLQRNTQQKNFQNAGAKRTHTVTPLEDTLSFASLAAANMQANLDPRSAHSASGDRGAPETLPLSAGSVNIPPLGLDALSLLVRQGEVALNLPTAGVGRWVCKR